MSHTRSKITKHPSYAGSGIALVAALCVTGLITSSPLQLTVVGIEALGIFMLLCSGLVRQRGRRITGLLLLITGSIIVCLSLGLSVVFPMGLIERGALIGGVFSPVLVLLGLYPLRVEWSRNLTGLGTALLSSSVVISEWVTQMGQVQLLLAVLLTVLAWDAAEQAITLGNDVGRGARTVAVSITHTTGSLAVGLLALTVAIGLYGRTPSSIPIAALVLLFGAVLLLLLALYFGDHR